ncbi:hypothetical protein E1264_28650 [Actinomadura sp. KC216]|uniref:hypothetical protein n=1 Tax=Actinomadura sp. KC216 TaxID=2530370 RepID=UPI00104D3DE9|nr:hypothetical protein [Actinomadura sp. KC216]TDB83367.1 hypothetical protein E1264_28650 [Actinomadura sp. KC216]
MPYSLEMSFHESLTVGQVARFLDLVRSAGATDEAVLAEIHNDGDESILDGWAYRPSVLPAPGPRSQVTLPARVVRDALDILTAVADSDGDVRDVLSAAEEVRAALQKAVMEEVGFPEVEG